MKIFFSAGEPSGDLHGANLTHATGADYSKARRPPLSEAEIVERGFNRILADPLRTR